MTQPSPSERLGLGACTEVISGFFFPGFTLKKGVGFGFWLIYSQD